MLCILPPILLVSNCFEFHFPTQWSHRESFHTLLPIGEQNLKTLLLDAKGKKHLFVFCEKGHGGFSPPQLCGLANSAQSCSSSPELLELISKKQAAHWKLADQIFSKDQGGPTGLNWLSALWEPKFLSFSP